MNQRTPWLLFAASLMFNVFFLLGLTISQVGSSSGTVGSRTEQPKAETAMVQPPQTLAELFAEADLEPTGELNAMIARTDFLDQSLGQMLRQDAVTAQELDLAAQERAVLHRRVRLEMGLRLAELIEIASPQQREMILRPIGEGPQPDAILKILARRFDQDGNEIIDAGERSAARNGLADYDPERMGPTGPISARFDLDGNGIIEGTEMEAARKWYQFH